MNAEDERLGQLLRAIRRRSGQTQSELAREAMIPRSVVMKIEAGGAGQVSLERLRRVFGATGATLRQTPWWNGASADRLLDERHAWLVERAVSVFRRRGWQTAIEVSFSEFGERGSIDILASHEKAHAIAVCEVKSAIGSLEETNRRLDAKERLAPRLAFARLGWRPQMVARILIVPEEMAIRRTLDRHAATMNSIYPARSREVRAWLRDPKHTMSGIWFLSEVRNRDPLGR